MNGNDIIRLGLGLENPALRPFMWIWYILTKPHQTAKSLFFISLACGCSWAALLLTAWGYYLDPAEHSPVLLRENAPARSKRVAFTVQDNFNLFTEKTLSPPILLPASDNFVPADIIESNMPIFSLFRNPLTASQDPFANFLYANLRIKKLLDEYAKIQERAKVLLGNSYQSGMIDLMTNASGERQRIQAIKNTLAQQDGLAREVGKLQQRLATVQGQVSTAPGPALAGSSPRGENKNGLASFQELQTLLVQRTKLIQSSPSRSFAVPGSGYTLQSPAESDNIRQPAPERPAFRGSGEVSLPWILDVPFKLFDYALSHKVLSLLIGFFCLIFLNIIFGSRS